MQGKSPLARFIESIRSNALSIPAHAHASAGSTNGPNDIEREPKREGSLTLPGVPEGVRPEPEERQPVSLEDGRRLWESRGWLVIHSEISGGNFLLARDAEAAKEGKARAQEALDETPPVVFAEALSALKTLNRDELAFVLEGARLFAGEICQ